MPLLPAWPSSFVLFAFAFAWVCVWIVMQDTAHSIPNKNECKYNFLARARAFCVCDHRLFVLCTSLGAAIVCTIVFNILSFILSSFSLRWYTPMYSLLFFRLTVFYFLFRALAFVMFQLHSPSASILLRFRHFFCSSIRLEWVAAYANAHTSVKRKFKNWTLLD